MLKKVNIFHKMNNKEINKNKLRNGGETDGKYISGDRYR